MCFFQKNLQDSRTILEETTIMSNTYKGNHFTKRQNQTAIAHLVLLLLRKDRDSNPGTPKGVNGFRDRPVRPLRHLSNGRYSFCGCKVALFSLTKKDDIHHLTLPAHINRNKKILMCKYWIKICIIGIKALILAKF